MARNGSRGEVEIGLRRGADEFLVRASCFSVFSSGAHGPLLGFLMARSRTASDSSSAALGFEAKLWPAADRLHSNAPKLVPIS